MNDRRAFLDQVLANPDDDVPRLIYADYLEEMGDPRGEFIRLQCELAGIDELHPRYLDATHRCDQLMFKHGEEWSAELNQDVRKAAFARGFIDKITIRARAFIKEAEQLYRTTPVNWLRFNYVKGAGPELANVESLANVRNLDLSQLKIPEPDLTALLASPHLSNLQSLNLSNSEAYYSQNVAKVLGEMRSSVSLKSLEIPSGSAFMQTLARTDGFPSLEQLNIGTSYADDEISGLANLKVPKLRALRVRRPLNSADCETLSALPVDQIERLDADSSYLPAKGIKHLAERGGLDQVVELSFASCGLGIRAVDVLFQGQRLAKCASLNLSGNFSDLAENGKSRLLAEKLAAHRVMVKLKRLHLGGLQPGDLEVLVSSPQFHNLELLELTSTLLGQQDIIALAQSPLAQSLIHLKLKGFEMEPAALDYLEAGCLFPNLRRLDIGKSYDFDIFPMVDDAKIIRLLATPSFANIRALNLDHLYMSAQSFGSLGGLANLPELQELSYCYNRVSRRSIDAVMNSLQLRKLRKLRITGASGLGNREKLRDAYGWRVQF